MDAYIKSSGDLDFLWVQYHIFYNSQNRYSQHPYNPSKCKNSVIQHALKTRDLKTIKRAFYSELRKYKLKKRVAWLRVKDQERFDAFSLVFYTRTGVDIEFARQKICTYLR